MEKMNCNVICDLILLYQDGLCSEESKQLVEQHIDSCGECRKSLERMKRDIAIPEEKDIEIIKKVKRRIQIEKMVIVVMSVIVVLSIVFFGGLFMLSTQVPMNDRLKEDNVRVEQDTNGDVWLIRSGDVVTAAYTIPDLYAEDGTLIMGDGKIQKGTYTGGVTANIILYESRMSWLTHQILGGTATTEEERRFLFNIDEKKNYQRVTYTYSNGEIVLWERK